MDGRNAGSAVIGFVNGMYILKYHSPHFPKRIFSCIQMTSFSLSLSLIPLRKKEKTKKRKSYTETFKNVGMTQRNGTHDNIGMK
jgi:hypothetical protein